MQSFSYRIAALVVALRDAVQKKQREGTTPNLLTNNGQCNKLWHNPSQ